MRVLHIVECLGFERGGRATSDAEVMACRAAVEGLPGLRHDVFLIADSPGEQRAAALGLRTHDRVTAPLGRAVLAWRSLKALGAARPAPEVIQPWSHSAARAARLAFAGTPVLGVPPVLPAPAARGWRERRRLRDALALDEPDTAILLLSDPAPDGHAAPFSFLIALLDFAGHRVAGVVPQGASAAGRARAFYRRAVLECPVRFSSLPAAALATACDFGVLHAPPARGSSPHAIERRAALVRAAQRAGLRVVVPFDSGVADAVDQGLCAEAPGSKPADFAKAIAACPPSDPGRARSEWPGNDAEVLTRLEASWRSASRAANPGAAA